MVLRESGFVRAWPSRRPPRPAPVRSGVPERQTYRPPSMRCGVPGVIRLDSTLRGPTSPNRTSMKVRILPFMEQQQVYNAYNFWWTDTLTGSSPNNQYPYSVVNLTVSSTRINSFTCPSDANMGNTQSIAIGIFTYTFAAANYAENLGAEPVNSG